MSMIFRRVLAFLVRLVVFLIGAVFAVGLLLLGFVLTLTLVAWALLRGRRPQVRRFKVDPRQPFGGFRPRGAAVDPANVVDVEAREVPSAPPRLDRS
ncbi:hypothetical protein [Rhizobacter sp. SG703]|uniref:hypothetical protein n=1 Tax=Rhizobacter sp. SG703 TaxID=2587140 RepID=UPI00144883EE|nr:hypothetical protein [Rhizobacter sp. SG703]NKI93592.1 hypothetical protein [Rhizobacter sp. SG703]